MNGILQYQVLVYTSSHQFFSATYEHIKSLYSSLITLKEEEKKRELFQNLNKIRDVGKPFSKVIVTHNLIKKKRNSLNKW